MNFLMKANIKFQDLHKINKCFLIRPKPPKVNFYCNLEPKTPDLKYCDVTLSNWLLLQCYIQLANIKM